MCVFVCRGVVCANYIPQAAMKSVWNPLLPQINISEQCELLCKREIIFENPPEPTLSLTLGQNEYNTFFGYMLISPSCDVVVSLFAIHILSRSGYEGSSPWIMTISMEMSHH